MKNNNLMDWFDVDMPNVGMPDDDACIVEGEMSAEEKIRELDKEAKIRMKKRKVKKQMEANVGLMKQARWMKNNGNTIVKP